MLNRLLSFGLSRRPIILLGLIVFIGGGLIAFSKLNIEAYPNPAPVILEITAQAAGQSAEEMERYYTIPIEVGLATTPGVDIIRSTSFYGLSFVRVTFKYGVDYYFAKQQAALSLQQNVNLPNNVSPTIQGSSLVGEVYRYQVVGPPHIGLTNLRTIQDWVIQRRLLTVEGVVQVVTWGGTTKEYEVEVDLNKLDAYNITLPQVIAAIGNANTNVGGRTINIGQQSANIRGIGLIDSGGTNDLVQGWKVNDIENIVLTQSNGVPVQVKNVAKVYVGNVPRLGKAGRDDDDDVVTAIVVMNRTLHTNDVVPRIEAAVERLNNDGTLPPGVKIVPYYDRTTLVSVTTSTVLHNLIFGCLLVFFVQWIFLGDLRSAIIVGVNIPFALFFSIILLVLRGEDANLLSVGAVDFGIIVDSAVILVENIFRNFQAAPHEREQLLEQFGGQQHRGWSDRLVMIYGSAMQVDRAVLFSTAVTVAAFVPLFTMQGVEGQIFNAHLRLRADRSPARDLHRNPRARVLAPPRARERGRDHRRARVAQGLHPRPRVVARPQEDHGRHRRGLSGARRTAGAAARDRIPAASRRGQSLDPRHHAADHIARGGHARRRQDAPDPAAASRSHHRRLPARPPR